MARSVETGKNRTGIEMSPKDSERMISGAREFPIGREDQGRTIAAIDRQYISEADPIGTVPMPGTLTGVLKTGMKKATGANPEVFLNKLGQRLAYERSGVRMYESVITKCEAGDEHYPVGPVTLDELMHIRDEEMQHFRMLSDLVESLGADPTAQTPDADVSGVASMGIQHVLNDPRTSMVQCLEMLLTLELADNAGWELLIRMADSMGLDDASADFKEALEEENEHLMTVRSWYEEMTMQAASTAAERRH